MSTRAKTEVFLIGQTDPNITSSGLPTELQVLKKYFYHQKEQKLGRTKCLNMCLDAIQIFWERARIPTMRRDSALRKMENLLKEYDLLVKNKSQKAESFRVKEAMFKESIVTKIMDIAHAKAKEIMENEADIHFLDMQREDPKSCSMGPVDMNLHRKEMRKRKKLDKIKEQQKKARKEQEAAEETKALAIETSSETSSGTKSDYDDRDFEVFASSSKEGSKSKKRSMNMISQDVAATFDRLNISYRDSAMSYAATAKSLGHDLENISISSSTMYRTRKTHRKTIAEGYLSEEFCHDHPLILHWDGKLLPDIERGKESVERIAVLVSGDGKEKLLGVPKVTTGTGEKIAQVCLDLVREHGMEDRVRGLSFDTTASNTGIHIGACILIEKGIGRELMNFPCRHHIYEVVLSHVFKRTYGPSSGPEIPVFKRFQAKWNFIDRSVVQQYDFSQVSDTIKELREKSVLLAREMVSTTHQRDDYKELLQLVLIFLGEATVKEFPLRVPGALHHARWMAKAIYSLKVNLLKNQFEMSSHEVEAMSSLGLFVSLVYIRGWSRAANSIQAARVDMEFLRDAEAFEKSGYPFGTAARDAMSRHLWYISETLIAMAFFDANVPDEEKALMVANLNKPASRKQLKRLEGRNIENIALKPLAEFVTLKTMTFFHAFNLNTEFLKKPVCEWPEIEGFKQAATNISRIAVVNDRAERAIALIKEFNSSLTKNEEQKQYLLKTVVQNRVKYPKKIKKELMDN